MSINFVNVTHKQRVISWFIPPTSTTCVHFYTKNIFKVFMELHILFIANIEAAYNRIVVLVSLFVATKHNRISLDVNSFFLY